MTIPRMMRPIQSSLKVIANRTKAKMMMANTMTKAMESIMMKLTSLN